ncbi:MAG: hypothetical protein Q9226_004324 [Calogaya cf. arnoldii]
MKRTTRAVIIAVSAILLILLGLLTRHFLDQGDQYSALTYARAFVAGLVFHAPTTGPTGIGVKVEDKIIVIGKIESENTDWVAREIPSFALASLSPSKHPQTSLLTEICVSLRWQRAIYTVNPSIPTTSNRTLTTPINKGHEAMVYLTYMIDNYNSLPSTMAFLHPHNSGFLSAWHTDTPLHSNSDAVKALNTDVVQKNGYVNLRCNWNPGCIQEHLKKISSLLRMCGGKSSRARLPVKATHPKSAPRVVHNSRSHDLVYRSGR